MSSNEKEGVCYPQPVTLADRVAIAHNFVDAFGYSVPMYVDDVTNAADELYAGWPERLYVIDEQGKIAYKGKTGPFGYEPDEVEAWFAERCAR
jgi:type I thyroxine 5'-deiodinase